MLKRRPLQQSSKTKQDGGYRAGRDGPSCALLLTPLASSSDTRRAVETCVLPIVCTQSFKLFRLVVVHRQSLRILVLSVPTHVVEHQGLCAKFAHQQMRLQDQCGVRFALAIRLVLLEFASACESRAFDLCNCEYPCNHVVCVKLS